MIHACHHISPGEMLPQEFYAVIQIPLGSNEKNKLDKPSGLIKRDPARLYSAVYYPPQLLAEDDDPLDVLAPSQVKRRSLDADLSPRHRPDEPKKNYKKP